MPSDPAKAKPSFKPKHLHGHAWWYEDQGGIIVVQQAWKADGTIIATETARIRWADLLKAAKRCGKLADR